jgi:hypothetical protein
LKGIGFINSRHFVESKFGSNKWQEVLGSLSRDDADIVRGASAVGWYDAYVFGRLLRAIDTICGKGDLSLMKEIGAYEAEQDFNRVTRTLMRVVEPMSIFKMAKRLWSHFQSSGDFNVTATEGGADVTLDNWVVDEAQCREVLAYVVRLVEFTGGKSVSATHSECRGRGGARCVFQIRWK